MTEQADPAPGDGTEVPPSHDTGYTFDAAEAGLLVAVIDEAFADAIEYDAAHDKIRPALLEMSGARNGDEPFEVNGEVAVEESAAEEPTAVNSGDGDASSSAATIGEPVMHEIDRALMYEFVVPFVGPVTSNLGHADANSPYVWPPQIAATTEAVADLWAFLADHVTAPAARARFHDLSMIRGRERHRHGMAARDAYLQYGRSVPVVEPDHAHSLMRAWAIDRMFGRAEGERECREAMAAALNGTWDAGKRAGGVLVTMLAAICRTSLSAADDPVAVDDLLSRASQLYATPALVAEIADLRRTRAETDEERDAISLWQVEIAAEEARQSDGMVKSLRLTAAIDLARRLNVRELQAQLTVELQCLPPQDTHLEAVSSTVALSRIPMEYYFRAYTKGRDWRHGLRRFASTDPPTGAYADLVEHAEERRRHPSIADIVSTVLLDEERRPTWQPQTDEERRDWVMAREAGFGAAFRGTHLAEALGRMRHCYGPIPVEDLTAFFALEGRGNYELAGVIARGLHHYWDGDLEACVHITVPRTESAIRLILRELDVALYRTQLGQRPGVYPALDSLLASLETLGFDESWLYFLRWFLASHSGKNLRNQIAHGRVGRVSQADAALALRALILVTLLAGPGIADDIDEDLEDGPVTSPPSPPQDKAGLALRLRNPIAERARFPPMVLELASTGIAAVSLAVQGAMETARAAWRRK